MDLTGKTRVTAYFQPQVWIRENATDTGPPIPFDVTGPLLVMGQVQARQLRDNREETDVLAPLALIQGHRHLYGTNACYYVYGVENAVAELFGA